MQTQQYQLTLYLPDDQEQPAVVAPKDDASLPKPLSIREVAHRYTCKIKDLPVAEHHPRLVSDAHQVRRHRRLPPAYAGGVTVEFEWLNGVYCGDAQWPDAVAAAAQAMESEEWRAFRSRPRSMVREEIERLRWCRSGHEFSRWMHCQAWLRAAIAPTAGSLRQHVSRDLLDQKRQIGASETHVWRRNAVVLDPTPLLFGDYSAWQNIFVMGIRAGQGWIVGMGEGNVW